ENPVNEEEDISNNHKNLINQPSTIAQFPSLINFADVFIKRNLQSRVKRGKCERSKEVGMGKWKWESGCGEVSVEKWVWGS
ncbi:19285_t:CDS:2, partial [Dentiscutata erythropus]